VSGGLEAEISVPMLKDCRQNDRAVLIGVCKLNDDGTCSRYNGYRLLNFIYSPSDFQVVCEVLLSESLCRSGLVPDLLRMRMVRLVSFCESCVPGAARVEAHHWSQRSDASARSRGLCFHNRSCSTLSTLPLHLDLSAISASADCQNLQRSGD
jgi:hypothetical protein